MTPSIGLRYGVIERLEIGIRISGVFSQTRTESAGNTSFQSDNRLENVVLTTQYQPVKNHTFWPDTLIFTELSAYDRSPNVRDKALSHILIGTTMYTVNDPIVISANLSYLYNSRRELSEPLGEVRSIEVGDGLNIELIVGFAANPDITLTAGVIWLYSWADYLQGRGIRGINRTQTNMSLGLAYSLTDRVNLTANVGSSISGIGGSTLTIGAVTRLGELPPPLSEQYKSAR